MKRILLITIWLLAAVTALAQTNTDKVRQFERLLREWKSAGFSTGSETYTQLKSMTTEGCKMSERIAEAYIDEYNATTIDIRANSWFQYIKEKQISISLRDPREKTDDDGRRIVYCWVNYSQPGRQDKEDFVGFKFDGGKIFYICNNPMERANRIKSDNEKNVIDTKPSAPFTITSCTVTNEDYDSNLLPMDDVHSQYLTPTITYNCTTAGSYDIYVKLYDSNSTLRSASSSPSGYTYKCNRSLSSGSNSKKLSGWGSNDSGHWRAGSYRYEFYYNGTLLYTHRFTVPQGQPSGGTSSGSGSSGGHHYIDLGLPSGTLWATTNIGANSPEEYGDYFAWGETSPKTTYSWNNYKYCKDGDYHKLTKYCNKSDYGYNGYTDSRTTLERSDDAATANWGRDWCMPTYEQRDELINNCYWVWAEEYLGHKVSGYIVYKAQKESDKGKRIYKGSTPDASYSPRSSVHIFLPAAGYKGSSGLSGAGSNGYYWSSSLDTDNPFYGRVLRFDSGNVLTYGDYRGCGHSVRAVRCKN